MVLSTKSVMPKGTARRRRSWKPSSSACAVVANSLPRLRRIFRALLRSSLRRTFDPEFRAECWRVPRRRADRARAPPGVRYRTDLINSPTPPGIWISSLFSTVALDTQGLTAIKPTYLTKVARFLPAWRPRNCVRTPPAALAGAPQLSMSRSPRLDRRPWPPRGPLHDPMGSAPGTPAMEERASPALPPQIIALKAAEAFRSSAAARCSMTTCSRSSPARVRASASCRRRLEGDADHYIVRFPIAASPPTTRLATCRCSGATRAPAPSRKTSNATCWRRTPHLRRGRQHAQHDRRLARARAGPRAAARVASAGIVLCGPSAGSLCWFAEALSAFHGTLRAGGPQGWPCCPTPTVCTTTPSRRAAPSTTALVGEGMRGGYAADDGVALHFRGRALHRVVTARRGAGAYRVTLEQGRVRELSPRRHPLA